LIGLTVKKFAHFRSRDRLFKILLEPNPARFQLIAGFSDCTPLACFKNPKARA